VTRPYKKQPLTGKRSHSGDGHLTAIELVETRPSGEEVWKCRCVCGKEPLITRRAFGAVRSCGCLLEGEMQRRRQQRLARRQEFLDRLNAGETMTDIARDLGISKQRVFQICNQE